METLSTSNSGKKNQQNVYVSGFFIQMNLQLDHEAVPNILLTNESTQKTNASVQRVQPNITASIHTWHTEHKFNKQ